MRPLYGTTPSARCLPRPAAAASRSTRSSREG